MLFASEWGGEVYGGEEGKPSRKIWKLLPAVCAWNKSFTTFVFMGVIVYYHILKNYNVKVIHF